MPESTLSRRLHLHLCQHLHAYIRLCLYVRAERRCVLTPIKGAHKNHPTRLSELALRLTMLHLHLCQHLHVYIRLCLYFRAERRCVLTPIKGAHKKHPTRLSELALRLAIPSLKKRTHLKTHASLVVSSISQVRLYNTILL